MNPGDRVIISGNHSWAGETGVYLEDRETIFGIKPVIKLDNHNIEVFVMWPNQARLIEEVKRTGTRNVGPK